MDFENKVEQIKQWPFSEVFDFELQGELEQPQFKFDILKKYLKFYVKILTRGRNIESKILRSDMVQCTEEMFSTLPNDIKDLNQLTRRLCPDMDNIKDDLKVKGLYSDPNERISFSIQAVLCDSTLDSTCANIEDIDELLETL